MGLIQRQSIKYTIVSLLGTLISAVAVIYVYPKQLDNYGLIQTIIGYNLLISPIIGLGFNNSMIHFAEVSPQHKTDLVMVCGLFNIVFGTIIFYAVLYILVHFVPGIIDQQSFLYQVKNEIFVIAMSTVLISTLLNFSYTLGRAVVPNLLYNVGLKIWITIIVILLIYNILDRPQIIIYLKYFYLAVFILLIIYTFKISGLPKAGLVARLKNMPMPDIVKYALYNGIAGIMTILALRMDVIYISELRSYTDVAKYSLPFFMANLLEIPQGGISSIMAPILAKNIREQKLDEASDLLQKASNVLLLASGAIFCTIFATFNILVTISGKTEAFEYGLIIFGIIGLAKLIDIGTGLNSHAITYSKYYKLNMAISPVVAVINVVVSYYFTKKFGIVGTAFSVLLIMITYNILKTWVLYKVIRISAFNSNSLKISLFIILTTLALILIKNLNLQLIAEVILGIIFITISNFVFIKYTKPSPELYELISTKGALKNILKTFKL